jgi:CHAD domain-containing protein
MVTEIRETEWKYDAAPGAALPDLTGLARVVTQSEPDEQALEATYYDTADFALARAGITLRRRTGGDDAGWHLKLPERPGTRTELRLPLSPQVPREFVGLLTARLRGRPVEPVARITTTRRRRRLRDRSGTSLAEVVLDSVTAETFGDTTTLTRWNEVEVELAAGEPGLLKEADKRLRRSGLRRSRHASKLEAALGGRLPAPAPEPELTAGSEAGEVVLAYLRAQVEELLSQDPMVRRDQPDAVHRMRVAARRLRGTLQSFRKVLRREDTQGLVGELAWLGTLLGRARDAEVLAEHLTDTLKGVATELTLGPVKARILGHYAPEQAAARKALLDGLGSDRYLALLDGLDRLLAAPPLTRAASRRADRALPGLVWKSFRRVRDRMDHAQAEQEPGVRRDQALHETRKAAKRARYAAEVAKPVVGKDARRSVKSLKRIQSVLGEHQDAVIARQAARQLGLRVYAEGENAFSYGLLHEREAERAAALQVQANHEWKRANRARRTAWMREA